MLWTIEYHGENKPDYYDLPVGAVNLFFGKGAVADDEGLGR